MKDWNVQVITGDCKGLTVASSTFAMSKHRYGCLGLCGVKVGPARGLCGYLSYRNWRDFMRVLRISG